MTSGERVRDPHEWLAEQDRRTAAMLAEAQDAQVRLAENTAAVTSSDRVVSITVNPGGGMTALSLSPDADRMGHRQLAVLIMTAYNQAARQAATRTMEIMADPVGRESEALDLVRRAMPVEPEPGGGAGGHPGTENDDDGGFRGFGGRR
ncbi:YbaB/EbfC family nucleoid-associated protein [Actinokineospora sp. PR83]|uniref:YbaB/EbfC family nucleoid-associated protein n=1 Tax=Actinokineospora sp. PR83 TaxID=2884908 RepID=UPI0027DF5068|nr:YbaB/EbfC family nucleoid-associated protein [Actinokineospora sp. PR83]MCG8918418.1 YbaB/EbfC family nucleoid-associated protein [Actinokineospora sp. PR83]